MPTLGKTTHIPEAKCLACGNAEGWLHEGFLARASR